MDVYKILPEKVFETKGRLIGNILKRDFFERGLIML